MTHVSPRNRSHRAGGRPARVVGLCVRCAAGLVLLATPVLADSYERAFLAGLADRGLFRMAEIHGTALWNRDEGDDREQAELAVELARIFTQQATALTRVERSSSWEKAHAVLDEYLERHPHAPEAVLIQVQRGWIELARGDLERIETEGTRLEEPGLADAREHLRAGIQQLRRAVETVELKLRQPSSSGGGFSEAQLLNLRRNLDLELGRAYRIQAMCYPPASADRDNAFLLAVEHLDRLVHRTADGPTVWPARLESLRVRRELGRHDEAEALRNKWLEESPPADIAVAMTAEMVRLQLARGDVATALETASEYQDQRAMQLVHLEALVARWREANDREPAQGDRWARRITSRLEHIRHSAAPSEVRQAERLVGRALAGSTSGQPADALKLAAKTLYYAGNWSEAVAAYDRAEDQLRRENRHEEAFDLGLVAAAIEYEAGRFEAATERYGDLARNNRQHDLASEAHLRAITSAAESLRIALPNETEERLTKYRGLLSEHLQRWPRSETADQVRWWSARLAMSDRQWADALRLLEAISPTSEEHSRALLAIAECFEVLLALPATDTAPDASRRREWMARARRVLQPAITGPDNRWPDHWSELQLELALRLARLSMALGIEDAPYAETLLRAAWSGVADGIDRPEQRETIQALLVGALLRQGKHQSAAELLVTEASLDILPAIANLARESPQNGDLQEIHAALLAESDSSSQWNESLDRWAAVERHSQRGGARWLRARHARIELLRRLDRNSEADKLEQLTQLLYPR